MTRALLIDPAVRSKIDEQRAWADLPQNWYHPERGNGDSPGDDPAYVLILEVGFRVVYTHTVMKDKHYRHISISIAGQKYPNPMACYTIAGLFGFTGGKRQGSEENPITTEPGPDWLMDANKRDRPESGTLMVRPMERLDGGPSVCR